MLTFVRGHVHGLRRSLGEVTTSSTGVPSLYLVRLVPVNRRGEVFELLRKPNIGFVVTVEVLPTPKGGGTFGTFGGGGVGGFGYR